MPDLPAEAQPDPFAEAQPADLAGLHATLLAWYAGAARPLPWRDPACSAWGVLVCEVMSQQTPVSRVEPVWRDWLDRWPTPEALAAATPGDAVRAWESLGYPRRALRLREAALILVQRHGGVVPADEAALRSLPGVGAYTAAAVAAFAFSLRTAVVDTNVRRVQARLVRGQAQPAAALSPAEMAHATALLPLSDSDAAAWNVAVMELGALVCTARAPRCTACPVRDSCAWVRRGRPAYEGPPRRGQPWHGSDRQVRGRVLSLLRRSEKPVPRAALAPDGVDRAQLDRCLDALLADGLVERVGEECLSLPS